MKKNFIKTVLILSLAAIMPVLLTGCGDDDELNIPDSKLDPIIQANNTETLVVSDDDRVELKFTYDIHKDYLVGADVRDRIRDRIKDYELYLDDVKQPQAAITIEGVSFIAWYQPAFEGKELQLTLRDKEGKIVATGGKIKIERIYVLLNSNVEAGGSGSCLHLCDDSSLLSMSDTWKFFSHYIYRGSPIERLDRWTENFTVPDLADDAVSRNSYLQDDMQRIGLTKVGDNIYFYQMFYDPAIQQQDYIHTILTYDGTLVKPYMEARSDFPKTVTDIQADNEGTLFTLCYNIPAIYKMDKVKNTYIFAGSETETGYKDGAGDVARFKNISMIKMDKNNNIYVAEETKIRKITPAGEVTTVVGTDESADIAGGFSNARFESIKGMTLGSDGKIYVMERKGMSLKIIDTEQRTVEKYKLMNGLYSIPAVHNPDIEMLPGTVHYQMIEKDGIIFIIYWSMNSGAGRAYNIGVIAPNDVYREQQ